MLNGSEKIKPTVNHKWTKGQRQAPNLKQILSRAKFATSEESGAMRCSCPRCRTCPIIKETEELIFTNSREKFKIRTKMDCTSQNLVYCIKCNGCGKDYIGQTGDQLKNRMTIHRQQINNPKTRQIKLSEHLENCARNHEHKFSVIPFYKIKRSDEGSRKTIESFFISKFKPELNKLS